MLRLSNPDASNARSSRLLASLAVGMPGFEPGVSRTRIVNVTVTPHPETILTTFSVSIFPVISKKKTCLMAGFNFGGHESLNIFLRPSGSKSI